MRRPSPACAPARRGVTLIEIILALAIVGLTTLPLIGLFSAVSDSAHNSADHTLTLALSSKIAEELRAASWENRHHIETLQHESGSSAVHGVVDDGSPFFTAIEDTAAPAGRIRPGEDAGIVPSMGSLHRELKNHHVLVDGGPTTSPGGDQLFDVSIVFDWSDVKDRSRRTSFEVVLPRADTATLAPAADRAAADKLIALALYGVENEPLAQVAATRGADLEMVRALGDVALISHTLENSEPGHQLELAEFEDAVRTAPNDTERARELTRLARLLENRACLRLRAATFLGPALETLTRFDPAKLGNPAPPPLVYREAVRLIAYLPLDFDWDLSDAILTCRRAVSLPAAAMPARVRNRLLERAAALAALTALTTGPDDPSLARAILEEMIAFNEGRNPNVLAQAQVELGRCRDAATLRATYEPRSRIAGWTRFTGNVITGVTMVLSGGQPATAGGADGLPDPNPPPPGSRTRPAASSGDLPAAAPAAPAGVGRQ